MPGNRKLSPESGHCRPAIPITARRGFTPKGVMFPISAVMLKNANDYEASLEAFSRQLMPLVEYTIGENGHMTVHNETAVWYRFIDMTPQAEALFRFIDQTVDTELAGELSFLAPERRIIFEPGRG